MSISLTLINAVQHVYLIAPTFLLPLGVVVLGSRVLPPVFGYLAFMFGAVLEILGLVGLFAAIQTVVDFVPGLFEIWVVAAAITLVIRTGKASNSGLLHERTPVVSHSQ